ncbi:MAG: hypothetical protein ACRDYD_12200, partial [Acidimicrobiales bacterium]
MREAVRGFLAASMAKAAGHGALAKMAVDMAGVARTVSSSPDLLEVLQDAGVGAATRRDIVTDLFGGRILPESVAALRFAVGAERP